MVKTATNSGIECMGLEDSFDGLIEPGRSRVPHTARRHRDPEARRHHSRHGQPRQPVRVPIETSDGTRDYSDRVIEMFHKMGLGALIVIGGDGTLAIAHQF